MKTKTLHILLALIIILATTNVYADGNKGKKEKKSTASSMIHKMESTFETELQFENWMLEIKEFTGREVIEEEFTFESWMLHAFESNNEANFQDNPECYESWMMEPFIAGSSLAFPEEGMKFEPWMMKRF